MLSLVVIEFHQIPLIYEVHADDQVMLNTLDHAARYYDDPLRELISLKAK